MKKEKSEKIKENTIMCAIDLAKGLGISPWTLKKWSDLKKIKKFNHRGVNFYLYHEVKKQMHLSGSTRFSYLE